MFYENLRYCDPPTIEDENVNSQINRLQQKNLQIREFNNVFICPYSKEAEEYHGEVLYSNGTIAEDINSNTIYDDFANKTFQCPDTSEDIEEAIYLGCLPICWGHYFTDGISKMWCIENPLFQALLQRNIPIYFVAAYIPTASTPTAWITLLRKLGLRSEIINLHTPTHFKKLYVPNNSLYISGTSRYYTIEYKQTIERLLANSLIEQNTQTYEKIYLSRLKLKRKAKEYGESAIQKAFQKAGYHIIYPETMSYEEQVWIYNHATSIVATKGSICMNSVFCRPGTELIVLRKSFGTHDYQYVINQVRELHVTHIDSHLSVFMTEMPSLGPFFLYINSNIVHFFEDRFNIHLKNNFSRFKFFIYALFCIQKENFYERNQAPKFYYQKMYEEFQKHPNPLKVIYHNILNIK